MIGGRQLDRVLARSPAQSLLRRRHVRDLTVLAYHGVEDPGEFAWQMQYVRATMNPIGLEQATAALGGGSALPPGAVLVTFDDGERSVLEEGATVLSEFGMRAIAFVIPGLLGTDSPYWWDEAAGCLEAGGTANGIPAGDVPGAIRLLKRLPNHERLERLRQLRNTAAPSFHASGQQLQPEELLKMASCGIEIGNHTFSHPVLDTCSSEELEGEIVSAHDRLSRIMGQPPRSFAFPNGSFDRRAVPVLERLGYQVGFLFDHRVQSLPSRDRFTISRVRVSSLVSRDRFRILLTGLHPALHALVGRN